MIADLRTAAANGHAAIAKLRKSQALLMRMASRPEDVTAEMVEEVADLIDEAEDLIQQPQLKTRLVTK